MTMSENLHPKKKISRRAFLKTGCLGAAAAGAAACGGAGLAIALTPDPPPLVLSSYTFGEGNMKKALIAYASATGSTAEVAAAIGKTLSGRGFAVEVRPVKDNPPVAGYAAVLIGSAIQGGKPLPEAAGFIRANREALQEVATALFLVHFFFRGDGEGDVKMRESYVEEIRPLLPRAPVRFFAGRFDSRTTAYGLPKWLARLTPTIDRRDWGKIRAWAEKLDL
jgi:menaquinone-dependent protoporphyrinogen oxidase